MWCIKIEVVGDDAFMVNLTIIRGAKNRKRASVLGEDAVYVYILCVLSEDSF